MAALNYEGKSSEEKGLSSDAAPHHDTIYYDGDVHHHLHRGLKSRQVAMIAIGGAIGTGLIIGT
jgi:yeast amino acid transporter